MVARLEVVGAARSPGRALGEHLAVLADVHWHQLMVLPFFCFSGVTSSTRPTTSGPVMSPPCRASSSRPTLTRLAAISAPVASAGTSARLPQP